MNRMYRGDGETVVRGTTVTPLAGRSKGAPFFATSFTVYESVRLRRDYLEMFAVTEGLGSVVLYRQDREPMTMELPAGRIVLFRPSDVTRFPRTAGGFHAKYVSFSETDWDLFVSLVGLDRSWLTGAEPPSAAFDPDDDAVPALFDTVISRFHDHPTRLDLSLFLSAMVPVLFPGYGKAAAGADTPTWLQAAVTAMREESNLRTGLPRLRELTHVSGPYLSVVVRRYFGRTPSALVTEFRILHAATLLQATDDSVRTIATRCGFSNQSHFSKAFRALHHLTPREYRVRSRGGGVRPTPER
jgi:AraC-like DNA-binding protein